MTGPPAGFAPFDLFPYNPSQAPAFAFVAMFGIAAIFHLVTMIAYRCAFSLPLAIGCALEAGGYYFRSRSHDDVRRTLPFIIQNLLILASPPFLAATIFMSPRRIARTLGKEDFVLVRKVASKLFVLVDVACLATQVAGAIMSGSEVVAEAHRGQTIIQVGLVLQIISFALFTMWTASLHWKLQRETYEGSLLDRVKWRRCMAVLYAVSLLFIIRSITRIIEYQQGSNGEMLSSEVYLYVLDASLMLVIAVIILVLHPGRLKYKVRVLAKKGYGYLEDGVHLQGVSPSRSLGS